MKHLLLYLIALFTVTTIYSCKSENKKDVAISNADTKTEETMIPKDTFSTSRGNLNVTLIGHGSVMFEYNGRTIHVDPYSNVADYSKLPKADLILITHEHSDHLDTSAINKIKKAETRLITTKVCNEILGYGEIMANGDTSSF
ncbi:MAG: MBL fold metallo-hydrolase, partial [Clostridium baratii]